MSDKKTKMNCRLITRGTQKANAKVIDDLAIPDPELAIGKQIIQNVTEEKAEDGGQSKNS